VEGKKSSAMEYVSPSLFASWLSLSFLKGRRERGENFLERGRRKKKKRGRGFKALPFRFLSPLVSGRRGERKRKGEGKRGTEARRSPHRRATSRFQFEKKKKRKERETSPVPKGKSGGKEGVARMLSR